MRLLLDGDIILHTAAQSHQQEVWWSEESSVRTVVLDVHHAMQDIVARVEALQELTKADTVTLVLGPKKRGSFRMELWPTYKAHRRSADYPIGLGEIRKAVTEYDPFQRDVTVTVSKPGWEGDDTLGCLMTVPWAADDGGVMCWSTDKDLKQIPGRHLLEDMSTEKACGFDHISEASANYWHMYQTLVGDQADGYPGLKGCGPVGAEKILKQVPYWPAVVNAFQKAGLSEADALVQARVARILRHGEEPNGWCPPV